MGKRKMIELGDIIGSRSRTFEESKFFIVIEIMKETRHGELFFRGVTKLSKESPYFECIFNIHDICMLARTKIRDKFLHDLHLTVDEFYEKYCL